MFEPAWSTRTVEDDPGAPFFNDTTKYVVSSTLAESTLAEPVWQNSELIGGYDAKRIAELKEKSATGLYVSGSATLVALFTVASRRPPRTTQARGSTRAASLYCRLSGMW